MKLDRGFYLRPGLEVARDLIGKRLVRRSPEGVCAGIIVEAEAYLGPEDAGAHSYGGRPTPRTAIQYGPGGFAYVFMIYGMYNCLNVVANTEGKPEVVLLRALEPAEGVELMTERRGRGRKRPPKLRELCGGPGKLCVALDIRREHNGADLCGEELFLEEGQDPAPELVTDRRVNIDYAGAAADYPWRFLLKDSPFVSVPPRTGEKKALDKSSLRVIE